MKQLVERERREREQRCLAATVIQKWYRWQKAGQAQRADYVRVRKAALTLQAVWRGVLARRNARVCGRGGEGGGGRVCWMGGRKEGRGCREEGWWRWRGRNGRGGGVGRGERLVCILVSDNTKIVMH